MTGEEGEDPSPRYPAVHELGQVSGTEEGGEVGMGRGEATIPGTHEQSCASRSERIAGGVSERGDGQETVGVRGVLQAKPGGSGDEADGAHAAGCIKHFVRLGQWGGDSVIFVRLPGENRTSPLERLRASLGEFPLFADCLNEQDERLGIGEETPNAAFCSFRE